MVTNEVANGSGSLFRPVEVMADLTDKFGADNVMMSVIAVIAVIVPVDGLDVGFAYVM